MSCSEITGTCLSILRKEGDTGGAKLEVRPVCALLQRSTTPSSQRFNEQKFPVLCRVLVFCTLTPLWPRPSAKFSSKLAPAVSSSYRLSALVLIQIVRFPSDLWIVLVRHCHNALFLSVCLGIVRGVAETVFRSRDYHFDGLVNYSLRWQRGRHSAI